MSLYQKQLGKIGEQRAEDYLKNNDFTIVKKNFRTYRGEIDIILLSLKRTFVLIEVK